MHRPLSSKGSLQTAKKGFTSLKKKLFGSSKQRLIPPSTAPLPPPKDENLHSRMGTNMTTVTATSVATEESSESELTSESSQVSDPNILAFDKKIAGGASQDETLTGNGLDRNVTFSNFDKKQDSQAEILNGTNPNIDALKHKLAMENGSADSSFSLSEISDPLIPDTKFGVKYAKQQDFGNFSDSESDLLGALNELDASFDQYKAPETSLPTGKSQLQDDVLLFDDVDDFDN